MCHAKKHRFSVMKDGCSNNLAAMELLLGCFLLFNSLDAISLEQ